MPRRKGLEALQGAESIGAQPLPDVTESVMPLDPTLVKSLGKPLSELLGLILRPSTPGTGLPSRIRLGNFDRGAAKLYGARKGAEEFTASAGELDDMLSNGMLQIEQPPQGAVDVIRKKLAALLGQ